MLKLTSLAVILCFLTACGSSSAKLPKEIISLPAIQYLSLDSTTSSINKEINKGRAVVIMYFDTECHLCQAETTSLLKNIDGISNTKIYMLSRESLAKLKQFQSKYGITQDMPIVIANDHTSSFINIMKVKSIPSTIIYGDDHTLVRIYEGEVLWNDIKTEIENSRKF